LVSRYSDELTVFIEGIIMKKLLLIFSLIVFGLSGCYVRGYHDDGYHKGHDHHRGDGGRDGKYDDKHR
jgi:hypothetical protein